MRVVQLDGESPVLSAVIALGDSQSKYLGFFPGEAFVRSAALGQILAAVDEGGGLQGYLLYYVARSRAVIQHLCVDPKNQGRGVGRTLVNHLRSMTSYCDGISLHCRRDFPAHRIWPKLGFQAVGEKPGRGKSQKTLTHYWLDYGHPDLMSAIGEALAASKHVAVVDANVFFDLHCGSGPNADESMALLADWLQESVSLWVTDELFNEIDRNSNPEERKRAMAFARSFQKVSADPKREEAIAQELDALLPTVVSTRDQSDRRHLAKAIAGGAAFLVTRDTELLRHSECVRSRFAICVLQPADLTIRFDELHRQAEYQPARLAGTAIQERKITADDVGAVTTEFLNCAAGEKKWEFSQTLRRALSDPRQHDSLLVRDTHGRLLALVVLETSRHCISVPLFRVAVGPLAGTLARNLAQRTVASSIRKGRQFTVITDPHLPATVVQGLREIGFALFDGLWAKPHLRAIGSPSDIADQISAMASKVESHSQLLAGVAEHARSLAGDDVLPEDIAEVERRIWPAKVDTPKLPSFIVPIQPRWAHHLFDEGLANQTLFGAVPSLALNCEHVYYRGSRPRVLSAPGRVLWYVSEDRGWDGTKAIRACSTLDGVVIGKAKDLYRRFQRLGVFEWNDVKAIAHGDAEGELMAVRFGVTELFQQPIDRGRLMSILASRNKPEPPLSTSYAISSACFREIYRLGTGIADKQ